MAGAKSAWEEFMRTHNRTEKNSQQGEQQGAGGTSFSNASQAWKNYMENHTPPEKPSISPVEQIGKPPAAQPAATKERDTRKHSYAESAGITRPMGIQYGAAASAPDMEKPGAAAKVSAKETAAGAIGGFGKEQKPLTEAQAIQKMARDSERAYYDYIHSAEYKEAVEAKRQKAIESGRSGGYAASAGMLPQNNGATPASVYAASAGITNHNEEDAALNEIINRAALLKNEADYWQDELTRTQDLESYSAWSDEDKALLQRYISGRLGSDETLFTDIWQLSPMGGGIPGALIRGGQLISAEDAARKLAQKYGRETVDNMAEAVKRYQNAQRAQEVQEGAKRHSEGFVGGTAASIGAVGASTMGSITAPIGVVSDLLTRTGRYKTLDPYQAGNLPNIYAGAVKENVSRQIAGEGEDSNIFRKGAALLYQGGMSAAENIARVAAGGKFGSLAMAAAGSFGQTVQQASEQGASPEQAIVLGVVNAGIEAVTEKIPLDNLFKAAKAANPMQALKQALIQGGIEATTEEISLFGTLLTEAAILREKSSYQQTIQEQMAQGKSYKEAKHFADMQILKEAGETAAVSFISGSLMEGGNQLANYTGRVTPESLAKYLVSANREEAQDKPLTPEQTAAGMRETFRQAMGAKEVDTQPKGQYNEDTINGGTEYAENRKEGLSGTDEAGLPGGAGAGQNGGHDPAGLRVHGRAPGDVGTGSQMVPGDVPGRSGAGDPEVRVRASGILRVSDQLRNARDNRSVRSYDLYDTSASPQEYEQALTAGRNSDPVNGWCVTPKSAQELAEGNVRTMMNADGTVGVGIAPDGDIVAVFKNKNGGPRGALDTAMPMAIEMGGDRLDCYGKGLVKVYENYGFIPVARVEFNPKYANEGWAPDKGTPYIYVMMHNGDSAAGVTEKMHTYRHATATELDALPTYDKDSYDDAMAYRDELLRERGQAVDNKLYNEDGTAFESVGAAERGFSGTTEYDALLSDENAQRDRPNDVRPVEVPKTDAQGRDVSEAVGNIYGSALTPDSFIPTIRKLLMDGELSHDVQTNEETLQKAADALSRDGSIQDSVDRIKGIAKEGKTSAQTVAEATLLYSYLVEETDALSQRLAADVFTSLCQLSTNSGRSVQVFSLFRRMTTQGQMMAIQQTVKRSVADLVRKGVIRKDSEYRIDPELMEEFRKASEDLRRIEEAERRDADADERRDRAKEIREEADREAGKAERRADRAETKATAAESAAQGARAHADERIEEAQKRQTAAEERRAAALKEAKEAEREAKRAERKADNAEQKADNAEERKRSAEKRVKDAKDAIYLKLASQMKVTPKAKWDAFRYMAMLGNVKTQVRNIGGNVAYMPYAEMKRALGAAMELAIKKEQRTKALVGFTGADKQLRAWAASDAKSESVHKALEYSAKLGDDTTVSEIRDNIQIFKTQWLETVRGFVSDVPAKTDMWFKEGEYVSSLSGFLKARGYTATEITNGNVPENILNEGRTHAIYEALKATFNDSNKFSDAISNLRYHGDNPFLKAISLMGEGVLPFRRTPANVVVRAVENSPVNMLRGFLNIATKVRKGQMSAATAIDQMAAGLTGTGAMALGYFLASGALGFLRIRGSGVDEDEERQGHQKYAIEIKLGDKWYSYTIDWAAPANLPLFVGANIYDMLSGESGDGEISVITSMIHSGLNSLEPMLALSCLSSLNDLFETARYAEEGTALYAVLANMATSYFTQGVPAIVRQTAQAFQPNQRQTFANNGDPLVRELQRKAAGIPIVGEAFRTDKINEWGQVENKGGWGWQIVNAFVNPGTGKQIDASALEQEISRLNGTQPESVSPPEISKTLTYTDKDGNRHENYRLTAEEYNKLATVQGQTAEKILTAMVGSKEYKQLTDVQKAKAIQFAYEYAREKGRTAAVEGYNGLTGWRKGISGKEAATIIQKALAADFAGSEKVFGEMTGAGVSNKTAYDIGKLMDSLKPQEGYKTVRDIQQAEAIAGYKLTEAEKIAALKAYGSDAQDENLDAVLAEGYSADQYVEMWRMISDEKEKGGDGTKRRTIQLLAEAYRLSWADATELYEIFYPKSK